MADLIDRQAAIDTAIEAADKWDGGYSSEREGIIRKFFDKVPAVQPDHVAGISKKAEGDCISRQAARHALCKAVHKGEAIPCENQTASCLWTGTRVCDYVREIDALPTAQPDNIADSDKKVEGDYISRKAALKICRRYWHPTYNPIMEEIEKLPPAQPEPHWISCSERLPEEGSYLVWMPFAPSEERIAVAEYCDGYWNIKTPISAWMPLPASYKGE